MPRGISLENAVVMFFTSPQTSPDDLPDSIHKNPDGTKSIGLLYALRREIADCKPPWARTLAVLAGIDLLAKFYVGSDEGSVGLKFKKFLKRYFAVDDSTAEVLYQLRNSMMHSFGLYSKARSGKTYNFTVTVEGPSLVGELPNGHYFVELRLLEQAFNEAVDRYFQDLLGDSNELRENFRKMFPWYGSYSVGPIKNLCAHV